MSAGERLLDIAMSDICCLPLRRAARSRYRLVRVLWTAALFLWMPVTAIVWVPLELVALLMIMFGDAWDGTL